MSKLSIPHHGMVFVGDGRKALFLRNEGDEKFPNLRVQRVITQDNPPTREQGTDKPGRAFAGAGANRRAGMEPTDWHDLEEHRFARDVAGALEAVVRDNGVKALIVVAPARTLADLRRAFHDDVKAKIVAEIDKDLTKHPVHEIEKHVVG
ncbi:MAG: host attachment protein [Alphaproteobacteria bacterium]|nr:host attachment protein [Alphaproteobacteria bacterium]